MKLRNSFAALLPPPDNVFYYEHYMKNGERASLLDLIKCRMSYRAVTKDLLCFKLDSPARSQAVEGKVVFINGPQNHNTIIRNVISNMDPDSYVIWSSDSSTMYTSYPSTSRASFKQKLQVLNRMLCAEFVNRSFRRNTIDRFAVYNTYLRIIGYADYLKKNKPKCVVMLNDHLSWFRSFRIACNLSGIPSVYIPHASVSESFPPLEFDYSLLEGKDMLAKYASRGPLKGAVYLLGSCRYDQLRDSVTEKSKQNFPLSSLRIGVAYNNSQSEAIALSLIDSVCNSSSLKQISTKVLFKLRPHPRLRHFPSDISSTVSVSNPHQYTTAEFLGSIDCLVTDDSNIILDSLMANVPVRVYSPLLQSTRDNYGFKKKGLVGKPAQSVDDILVWLKLVVAGQACTARLHLEDYDEALCEKREGTVARCIAEFISTCI